MYRNQRSWLALAAVLVLVIASIPAGRLLADSSGDRAAQTYSCPTTSSRTYSSDGMYQYDLDNPVRPAWNHADKNLALRSYSLTTGTQDFVVYGSDDPVQPPQFATLFNPDRSPVFSSVYRANHWNWAPSPDPGTRGTAITSPPVTVLGLATTPGEALQAPSHGRNIGSPWGAGGSAVIFADADSITLKFTREDSAATGYTVHIDNICTDPALLALYNSLDNTTRNTYLSPRDGTLDYNLPGLTAGQVFGTARSTEIRVAIVDTGTFQDPRSRDEWWQIRPPRTTNPTPTAPPTNTPAPTATPTLAPTLQPTVTATNTPAPTATPVSGSQVCQTSTSAPCLVAPANGASVPAGALTFSWQPEPDAAKYRFVISQAPDFSSGVTTVEVTTTSTVRTLAAGTYYWKVRRITSSGSFGTWSSVWSVKVLTTSQVCTTSSSAPCLVAPANGASVPAGALTFSWQPEPDAAKYRFVISQAPDFSSGVTTVEVTTTSTVRTLAAGTYYWKVRRITSSGSFGTWSSTWKVTVTP